MGFIKFFLFIVLGYAQDQDLFRQIESRRLEMNKLLEKAKSCVPQDLKFCTGVSFQKNDWARLRDLDLKSCQREIESQGYKVLWSGGETNERYPHFVASTLRAEIIYKDKVVLLKTLSAGRIDCLHELFHLYQSHPHLRDPLAPLNRKKNQDGFVELLNLAITETEKLERQKKTQEAKKLSDRITPEIAFVQSWQDLDHWLDEKDVHYFIYSHCQELKCTELDFDVAVSNLYLLREKFPPQIKEKIESEASKIVRAKEKSLLRQVKSRWKSISLPQNFIEDLLDKKWPDLLVYIRDQKLKIEVGGVLQNFKGLEKERIPTESLKNFPVWKGIKSSKIKTGEALAKFIPPNLIVITPDVTKGSLIHEFLHYKQTLLNSHYAEALLTYQTLQLNFEKGKIGREEFEKRTVENNLLFWIAELEVYEAFHKLRPGRLSKIESLNNDELYKKYKTKLEF